MANIKFGQMISEARGKLNGMVFSRNAAGSFIRAKVSPTQPRTARQQQVRQRLAAASAAWRGLTDEQREAWKSAALTAAKTNVFGDGRPLTGHQFFVRLARLAQELGVTILTDPPAIRAADAPESLTLTATASPAALSLAFSPSPLGTGVHLVVEATDTISPGISNATGKFRQIFVSAAAATSPLNLLTAWQNKFGSLTAGLKVFVRVYAVDETVLIPSPVVIASAIVS